MHAHTHSYAWFIVNTNMQTSLWMHDHACTCGQTECTSFGMLPLNPMWSRHCVVLENFPLHTLHIMASLHSRLRMFASTINKHKDRNPTRMPTHNTMLLFLQRKRMSTANMTWQIGKIKSMLLRLGCFLWVTFEPRKRAKAKHSYSQRTWRALPAREKRKRKAKHMGKTRNRKCGEWAEHVLVWVLPGQENSIENYFAPFLVITLSVTP